MGIWQKIKSTVKKWLGGGSKSTKATPPRTRVTHSNPQARNQTQVSRGRGRVVVDVDDEKEKKRVERENVFKAVRREAKDITASLKKESAPDPKVEAAKKSRAEMRKKLDAKKQERKEWHEATNNRFNVGEKGISEEERKRRRQNVKTRAWDEKTAVKEAEHTMKWHGKEESFARGALSGATFGASDLAAKKLTKGEAKKAEEVYQKNKHKGYEVAGEVVGSLASFGGTAGLTDRLGEKVISKAAPKAAERLAEKKLIQNAAKKSVTKAVEKGSVKGATKELIEQVGKDRAKKIVNAVGNDIVQNATTGLLYDFNKASTEYEVGSPEWWREMGKSAAFNAAITGVVGAGSALTGGKRLVSEAAGKVADRARARAMPSPKRLNIEDLSPDAIRQPRPRNRVVPRIGESIEDRIARVNAERLGARADDVVETATKTVDDVRPTATDEAPETIARNAEEVSAEKIASRKPTKNEKLRDELRAERESLQAEYEDAMENGGDIEGVLADMQETDARIKDLDYKIAKTDKAREAKANGGKAVPPEAKAETKATPPNGDTAKEAAEEEAADGFEPKMRGRYDHLNAGLKKETEGKVGVRKGSIIAEERASEEERKRIIKEAGTEINQVIKDAHENAIHGGDFTYKVLSQGQRDEMFFDSYNTVRNSDNVGQVVEELENKMDKILRESETNPWGMTDQITLKDLSDMLAVEQVYRDAGKALPPEYEEIMTRLITLQGTQYGQGNRGRYLILKERSPRFRETLLTKNTAKYIDNVFGEDRLKDISRSLDKNHGEKNYLENELKRIADYENTFANLPADERQAAADRAYKELQKDILRNAKMTVWDAINLYRHTGMLSALATGGRNILGNASQFLMRELSDKATYFAERGLANASGLADDFTPTTVLTYKGKDSRKLANSLTSGAVGKLTKTDDAYFDKFADKEYARKITDVVNDAVADMMNIEKYETHAQKGVDYVAETAGEKAVKGFAWLPRKATKAVNFMLNEPDSWFVETRFRKGLMRYLEANGITDSATLAGKENVLRDAIEHAKGQALEDTYKKANRVTSFLEKIRSSGLKHDDNLWRNLAKKGAMITLDAELPYLKVPVNVGINTIKYSPINIVKSVVDANTAIRRGDVKALSKAAEELSKGLTGTALATIGFLLNCDEQDDEASNGFIAKARDELKEYGIKDYSLKVGDHVYDISNIGQGATQLLMGTRAAEIVNENGGVPKGFLDKLDLVRECFAAPVDSIAEMGILDNALGIIDAFSNEGDYEKGFAERVGDAATSIGWDYAGQFIPQPLRGVARGTTSSDLDMGVRRGEDVTPTQRRLQSNVNKFVGAIPVVNEKVLPHKVDSHGNYVNERKTNQEKLKAVLNNTVNPIRATKVHIPEADKIELSVKDENGKPFKPNGFDRKREYKTGIGQGKYKETIDLTGKEREQVARAAKHSGYDMANALVKKGMFGDRLGDRAQEILRSVPDDEEKAREMFFSTPEWKRLSNEEKNKYLNILYGQGGGTNNRMGVERTRKAEAYIGVAGNSEGDFRYQNDLNWQYQKKYEDNNFAALGIDKGTYADVIQAIYDSNHKWDEEKQKNIDTPNSARKVKAGILAIAGLTPEQRVAIYQAIRGKRNGFGWYDWDGISAGGGYYRRGYRRWRHYGHGGGGSKARALKQSNFKATKRTYKDTAAMLKTTSSRSKGLSTASPVKVEPPKVKFKRYDV